MKLAERTMAHDAHDDWQAGQLVFVPHLWRDDNLWNEIQVEAQQRIGSSLREVYGHLLQQPLSPALQHLANQIDRRFSPL
jgi:hypothetical protein